MSPPSQVAPSPFVAGAVLLIDAKDSLLRESSLPVGLADSSASCLLFLNASNKSTRSLHCSSIDRSDSCNAFSVSVLGW